MDGVLFEKWVLELDQTFSSEGRSVALVIDNCLTRPRIKNLKSIKLFFLPPSTTLTTQLMNVGVISSLKAKYHKNMNQNIIRSLKKNNALPEVLFLKAMQMLVFA